MIEKTYNQICDTAGGDLRSPEGRGSFQKDDEMPEKQTPTDEAVSKKTSDTGEKAVLTDSESAGARPAAEAVGEGAGSESGDRQTETNHEELGSEVDTPRLPRRKGPAGEGFLSLDDMEDEETARIAFEMQNAQLVGSVISERYEVDELIGRGGMSSVYRTHDKLTGDLVAFKVMHAHLLEDPGNIRRFRHEAAAARRVEHPNAVKLLEVGVTPYGSPYLIMEYVDGPSLATVIKDEGKLSVTRCLDIFVQACDAMAHVHKTGVLHRDLKPSNIVILRSEGGRDHVKVVDFGIAKVLSEEASETRSRTPTGHVVGSPPYMSPEQCRALNVDERSDIYSMGCLMYEALTGRVPLEGETIMETMYKQINEMPAALTGVDGDVRLVQGLESIIFKAMAKEPGQRFQSMQSLGRELEGLRDRAGKGLKIQAYAFRQLVKLKGAIFNRLGTSKKLVLSLSLLVLLIVVSAIAFYFPLYGLGGDPTPREREISLKRDKRSYAANPEDFKAKEGIFINNIKLALNRFGGESPEVMEKYELFGDFYRLSGRYHQAFKEYSKALSTAALIKMAGSTDAADLCVKMGICCIETGMYKSGIICGDQAGRVFDALGRKGTDEHLKALAVKCESARRAGFKPQADEAVREFLTYWRMPGKTRTLSQDMGESAYYIAEFLSSNGNFREAEDLYKTAAVSWRERGSQARHNYAVVLNKIGLIEMERNNYEKACHYFERAIDLFKRADDEDESPVAKVLFNLKDAEWKKGDWFKALSDQAKARKMWEGFKDAS